VAQDQDLGARDRVPPGARLMQDFTGVPAVVDLAAMRDAMKALGGDPRRSTRWFPSIWSAIIRSVNFLRQQYRRQEERRRGIPAEPGTLRFLKWSQKSFDNFRVVPPGTASATRSISNTSQWSGPEG